MKHKNLIIRMLNERGIELLDIAQLTYDLQKKYIEGITLEHCLENVDRVLEKREVQHAVMTGIELDVATEKGHFNKELTDILRADYGL